MSGRPHLHGDEWWRGDPCATCGDDTNCRFGWGRFGVPCRHKPLANDTVDPTDTCGGSDCCCRKEQA